MSKRRRPAIVIKTIEGRWPDGYTPLYESNPERYHEQLEKLRKAGIKIPDAAWRKA